MVGRDVNRTRRDRAARFLNATVSFASREALSWLGTAAAEPGAVGGGGT
jgi:hypothetical protein